MHLTKCDLSIILLLILCVLIFLPGCTSRVIFEKKSKTPIYIVSSEDKAWDRAQKIVDDLPWRAEINTIKNTGSMWPTIDSGCLVVRAPKPFELIKIGEIVSFFRKSDSGDTYDQMVHRIVLENEQGFISRGDALNECDPEPVTKKTYIGTIVAIIRFRVVPYRKPIALPELERQKRLSIGQASQASIK